VSSQPRALFALDFGSTTTSVSVLGRVGGRWRLVAHTAAPSYFDVDSMLAGLLSGIGATDPEMLTALNAGEEPDIPVLVSTWPRLVARSTPERQIAVVAGSRRQRRRLETAALRAGWAVVAGSADEDDAVVLSRLILSTKTSAVLFGADHVPGGDEKRHLPDLAALVAGATRSRPELTVVLAGGAAVYESQFAALMESRPEVEVVSEPEEEQLEDEIDIPAPEPSADEAPPQTKMLSRKVAASQESAFANEASFVKGEAPAENAPAAAASSDEVPAAEMPDAEMPDADGPDAEMPDADRPDAEMPAADRPDAEMPAAEMPAADGPSVEVPAAGSGESSSIDETETGRPPAEDSLALEPAPAAADPDPIATDAATRKPATLPLGFQVADGPAVATHLLLAPDAEAGQLPGDALQEVLEGLRALPNDSRLGVARSIASLAYVLDRTIEVVEVGMQGGLVARSDPFGQGHFTVASSRSCPIDGSFAPSSPSEEVIDGVLAWSTIQLDRHRAMDRLNDLRLTPWGEADGDGAVFRLAAAKAAFGRLIESMPELAARSMPELVVAAGGIFASLPPSVVALALADLVRRPGVCQLTVDQARILGPIGAIEDEDERRQLLANLADDILVPLGALILPAGIKPGKNAGSLRLKAASAVAEIELHPGAIQVVDLPPGRAARADIDFRDSVRLGKRGHHFTVDVGGGLSGLLVDLRDIPMRISDRPDSRRSALDTWQRGMWPEVDE
jgi:hypothetical protein